MIMDAGIRGLAPKLSFKKKVKGFNDREHRQRNCGLPPSDNYPSHFHDIAPKLRNIIHLRESYGYFADQHGVMIYQAHVLLRIRTFNSIRKLQPKSFSASLYTSEF